MELGFGERREQSDPLSGQAAPDVAPRRQAWLVGWAVAAVAGVLLLGVSCWAAWNWDGSSRDTLIHESRSPGDTWGLRIYYVNPGATGSEVTWGEVERDGSPAREMYLEVGARSVVATWASDSVVIVNGHAIDVRKGSWFSEGDK